MLSLDEVDVIEVSDTDFVVSSIWGILLRSEGIDLFHLVFGVCLDACMEWLVFFIPI
jgi:hypothetical protein